MFSGSSMNLSGRSFLFLQGLASPFFDSLGEWIRSLGGRTLRVNFCPGDQIYWHGPAVNFSQDSQKLTDFYNRHFDLHAITDLVLFGDTRQVHQPALKIAASRDVRIHVFEEGYLRPHWITVERGGVNANSPLPRNPRWYLEAIKRLPPPPEVVEERVKPSVRAIEDMAFHMANFTAPISFPKYRTHRPRPPALEYAGWALRLPQIPLRRNAEENALKNILATQAPVFFLPLQLSGDSQITKHSQFRNLAGAMGTVIQSFAEKSPKDARLIIKNHPLDTGLDRHGTAARRLAKKFGVCDRVSFFETGHLPTIAERVSGTVVVNSTVGLAALGHGCPVKTLANPIYNLPGLTFQGTLDEFWNGVPKPDRHLYRAFRDVLLYATQVNGNFFTRDGINLAIKGCDRMLAEESPLEILVKMVSVQAEQHAELNDSTLGAGKGGVPMKSSGI
ncbi:MAG: capsule biosynthesis protein [Spartobacteria bacterium]